MKVAAIFLSLALAAQGRIEVADVDPLNYESKEVPEDGAAGGIAKLHDQGVLSFKSEEEARNERKGNLRKMYPQPPPLRILCPGQHPSEYCDCAYDCTTTSLRCACEEAATQSCCGP